MKAIKKLIFQPLIGFINLTLHILNLLICLIVLLIILFIGLLIGQKRIKPAYDWIPVIWAKNNLGILRLFTHTQLNILYLENEQLSREPLAIFKNQEHFLITANHQNWTDILLLFHVFSEKIPLLKFFAKKQLLYVPILGFICWLYGFPFLQRHTAAQLKKHPEWRKKDIETTKKACERFKKSPGSLVIFAEGTRFNEKKRAAQSSPYQYLLKPKVGGLGMAVNFMEGRIKTLIDVTIIYPPDRLYTFWDYCCGNIRQITLIVEALPIPPQLKGDTENDPEFRQLFQKFIYDRWEKKDALIKNHYHSFKS